MPKKFDPEVKDRAVRMVLDRVEEAGSVTKAVALVSPKVDVGRETLRRWVSQHRVDAGLKDGPTSDDLAELRRLRSEVKRLRESHRSPCPRKSAQPPPPRARRAAPRGTDRGCSCARSRRRSFGLLRRTRATFLL